MKNIAHLLDVVDKVRDHVALGLMSDPGLSKTAQVKQWAEKNGRQYCELIISQRMPSEISGMPMPIPETQTMEVFDFDTLLQLEDGDVLAFDEFTNGNIQTLNACLTLIQERTMLSGKKLPSLVIVAMGNPQGRCDLLPQTKQRFWWVDVTWDQKTWISYMKKTWGFTPHSTLTSLITEQYRQGFNDSKKFNYFTPRTVENLLRIALVIDDKDPFWEASELQWDTVHALYSSIQNKDEFRVIRDQLINWVQEQTAESWSDMVTVGLAQCETMTELRHYLREVENSGYAPKLFEYMKEVDKSGE